MPRASAALCRARRRQRQHRIDCLRVARGAQLLGDILVAQQPRDPGQRLEVIGPRPFRREQQEDEVDRLAVHRLEIDRSFQPGKQTKQLLELRQLAMRDGHPVADGRRTELLALQQDLENGALVLPAELGCMRAPSPGPESGGFYSNPAAVPTPLNSFRDAILKMPGSAQEPIPYQPGM